MSSQVSLEERDGRELEHSNSRKPCEDCSASQETRQPPEDGKRQGMDSPSELVEGVQLCQHLHFRLLASGIVRE